MPHQIDGRIQIEAPAQAELVPGSDEPGETSVTNSETVLEVHSVPSDAEAAFEVQAKGQGGIVLSDEQGTAERFNRIALFVDPRQHLASQSEMRAHRSAQA